MSDFTLLTGFQDAIMAAADLDAFGPDTPDDYSRGQVGLIKALFIRNDPDPGSDEALEFIEQRIRAARSRR